MMERIKELLHMGLGYLAIFSSKKHRSQYFLFEEANEDLRLERFDRALEKFKLLAERGEALSMHNLGSMYFEGQGCSKDYEQAAHWWKLASEQGIPESMRGLGIMLFEGVGVPADREGAITYLVRAAEEGDIPAMEMMKQIDNGLTV